MAALLHHIYHLRPHCQEAQWLSLALSSLCLAFFLKTNCIPDSLFNKLTLWCPLCTYSMWFLWPVNRTWAIVWFYDRYSKDHCLYLPSIYTDNPCLTAAQPWDMWWYVICDCCQEIIQIIAYRGKKDWYVVPVLNHIHSSSK